MIEHNHPQIGSEELAAVARVLESRHLAQGAEVEAFESEFAASIDVDHAVAVANGTAAIEIGLMSMGIGWGDEVIVPSFTFVATANAVRRAGATPVFADIDPKTYCLSAASVEPHLTARTKAVLAVHLYGHPADLDGLSLLCDDRGVMLLEDSAQGLGAAWKGRPVGSFGVFGTFSFYATKNITTGEGGMITTNDRELALAARALRTHQSRRVGGELKVGTNVRMTDIAAAIGRVQLGALDGMQSRRREIADAYEHGLSASIATPYAAPEARHGYHLYTIRCQDRDAVIAAMTEGGVGYGIWYDTPCHLMPEYRDGGAVLPETESAAREVVSLPIRPDLTDEEVERIVGAVNKGVA